jgi:REP element-mobilizing transposase RayT
MANTYSQNYVHIVFSTKYRRKLIDKSWKDELNAYVGGTIRKLGQRIIIVNSMPDHIHIFLVLRPNMAASDLMRKVKYNSTLWIRKKFPSASRFQW